MADIEAALITLPWQAGHLETLTAALAPAEVVLTHRLNAPRIARALRHVDVAFLAGDIDDRFLSAPNLRWVHCGHAGLDRSARPDVLERGLLLTSSAGRSSPALAEHAMFFMLALSFRFGRFYQAQLAGRWGVSGQYDLRALHGQVLGIVGLGNTGIELAKRASAFGMRVLAYRRRGEIVPAVDQLYSADRGDTLDALLEQSDYVVLTLPLTDDTYHLIGARELALMRPDAQLINIARGGLVDEQALLAALHAGSLAGAAIDVAESEPLPRESELWRAPNLLITPHVTPQCADREQRSLQILLENIRRYRAGESMLNQLTRADVFSGKRRTDSAGAASARLGRFIQRLSLWLRTR